MDKEHAKLRSEDRTPGTLIHKLLRYAEINEDKETRTHGRPATNSWAAGFREAVAEIERLTTPPPAATVEAVAKAIRDARTDWADLSSQAERFPIDNFDRQLATAAIAAMQPLLADREGLVERLLNVRARNAGNFDRSGAAWEAYDRAVLDCIAALPEPPEASE